jgi:hypothetical protein
MKKILLFLFLSLPFLGNSQAITWSLSNVENTNDANKPISTATQTALNLKANSTTPTFTGESSFSGVVRFLDNISLKNNQWGYWKDGAGTDRKIIGLSNANFHMGDIDNAMTNSINLYFANYAHFWFTNGTEKMRLLQNGYLGIGTSTPTSPLEVVGDIKFGSGTDLQTALNLKANSASPTFTGVFTSNSTKHLFGTQTDDGTANQFSGNVIAKSSLFVTGNSSFGTTNQYGLITAQKDQNANTIFFLTNRGSGSSQRAGYCVDNGTYGITMEALGSTYTTSASATGNRTRIIATSTPGLAIVSQNNSLSFWTNNPETEKMTILTNGNTGIGTTTPSELLEVNGNLLIDKKLKVLTGSNASTGTATLTAGTVTISTTAVTSNSLVWVQYHGNTGMATSVLTVPTITNGTSFVINAITAGATTVNMTDTNTVKWWIIN